MSRTEELREEVVGALGFAIADYEKNGNGDPEKDYVPLDYITAKRLYNIMAEPAKWQYYTNDEGKARWRCTACGKIVRRNPHDKKYCSNCSKPMTMEA